MRRGVNRGQGAIRRTSAPAPHHASLSQQQQRRQDISSSDSDLELAVEPMVSSSRPPPSYRTSVSLTIGATPPSPRLPSLPPSDNLPGPSGLSRPGLPRATSNPPSALPPSNPATAPNALIPVKVKYLRFFTKVSFFYLTPIPGESSPCQIFWSVCKHGLN